MAARHVVLLALFASLFLAGCPSSPPLTPEEIPGDFQLSYEMKVTDEDAFRQALEAEERKAAAAATPSESTEEGAAAEEPAEPRGLPRTYVYVEIREPGHVKYEVHFGFGNPVKRTGELELNEAAFEKIYRLVRNAEVSRLKKRYVGAIPTGKSETYVVKGNLKWQVIDVKGEKVPTLERMWSSVREILLDKESRIFDNPEAKSEIFIIDRRSREFHRGDCPRLADVPEEKKIRKDTLVECLDAGGWPCETCRPLDDR